MSELHPIPHVEHEAPLEMTPTPSRPELGATPVAATDTTAELQSATTSIAALPDAEPTPVETEVAPDNDSADSGADVDHPEQLETELFGPV